jgi:serine/threonine protein kinase
MQEKIIGKYKILEEIGRGGMGVVYKGRHLSLSNLFAAIKTLPAQLASDEMLLSKFMAEADILAKLQHQNIVNIYDIETQDETHYLIMEYVNGQTLAELLKAQGVFPPDKAAGIICDVARALSHSHKKGIIHRDIKPANIMIDENGVVKVTDFGIARATESTSLTQSVIIGTPKYMAPERIKAEKDIDGRSDIYSLGIVFYEIVTGKVPFHDNSEFAVLEKQVKDPPPPPSSLIYDFPVAYERIILKCLEKNKVDRYSGCEELVADLKNAISGRESAASGIEVTTKDKSKKGIKPRFGRIALLGGAALITLAVLIFFMSSDRLSRFPGQEEVRSKQVPTVVHSEIEPASPVPEKNAPSLRPFKSKNEAMLASIKDQAGAVSEADVHRLLAVKAGVTSEVNGNSDLFSSLESFLESNQIITKVDDGGCDVLLTISGHDQDEKLTVQSNVYGEEVMKSHVEVLSVINKEVLFSELDAIIKRDFCFSALRTLSSLNSRSNEIGIKIETSGKTDRIFQIGDSINICVTPKRKGYCMLFDINLDGIYCLFPKAGQEKNLLTAGETRCSGSIEVSPPTGNEMVFAMMSFEEDMLPLQNYHFTQSQVFYRWSYDLSDEDNAVSLCQKLMRNLSNEPVDMWCTRSVFIKTIR